MGRLLRSIPPGLME